MKVNNPLIKAKREVIIKNILHKWKRTWPEWFNLPKEIQDKMIEDEGKQSNNKR